MHRLSLLLVTLLPGLALNVQAGPVPSGKSGKEPVVAPEDPFSLPGTFNTGIKTSDVYTEGHISLVVPLWSTLGSDNILGGNYVFLTPYTSLGERGELANSLGLGWRYLFNDQSVDALKSDAPAGFLTEGFYVGASVFVDNLRTQFDNDFWQFGFGAEIGSRYVTLRGNYYLPFDGDQKLADQDIDVQRFTTRSQSSSTQIVNNASAAAPFATGNTLQQDVNFTSTAVTTTRTTTTRTTVTTITSLFEEGMEGWDAELQFLIPGLDKHMDVSVIGGYYSFDNQPFGPQDGPSGKTEGWKAGLEIRPVPGLIFTGMWYEDEGLTGSEWVAGVRLQIPLGKEWKDAFKSRRRHLIERLAEPVARQNAAIKTANKVDQDQEVEQQSTTTTAVSRRIISQSSQRITIAEDIIFVNNGGNVGNGIAQSGPVETGVAELPFNTIQEGADLAGNLNASTQRVWTVYTQGAGAHGGSVYNESVTISGSSKFTSSAVPIVSYGQTFGTGDYPVVTGGFAGMQKYFLTGPTTPASVSIGGYDIRGGYDNTKTLSLNIPAGHIPGNKRGIYLDNIGEVELINNIISGTEMGAFIENEENQNLNITGNIFKDNTLFGLAIYSEKDINGVITGNIATGNGFGGPSLLAALGVSPGSIPPGGLLSMIPIGSIFPSMPGFPAPPTVTVPNVRALNDPFSISGIGGIGALALGNFNAEVSNNVVNDNAIVGIVVGGVVDTTSDFFGNSASGNLVGLASFAGHDYTGNIYGNTATNNLLGVLALSINDFTGDVFGNTTNGNLAGLAAVAVHDFTGNIFGNTANNNWLGIAGFAIHDFTGSISGNTATQNLLVGLVGGAGHNYDGIISGNNTSGNGYVGLAAFTGNDFNGVISQNVSNDNYYAGMYFIVSGKVHGSLDSNTANNNGMGGIGLMAQDNITGNITNNVAMNNGYFNMQISTQGILKGNVMNNNTSNTIAGRGMEAGLGLSAYKINDDSIISNNVSSNNDGDGISIYVDTKFNGNLIGNTTNNNGVDGIYVEVVEGFNSDLSHNTSIGNGDHGLHLIATSMEGDIEGNTVSYNGDDGILIETSNGFRGNVANNTTSFNGDDGIDLSIGGSFTGDITNNVANNNLDDGHDINVGKKFIGNISGNQYFDNTTDGLYVTANTFEGNITNNTAGGTAAIVGIHGIHVNVSKTFTGNVQDNLTMFNDVGMVFDVGTIYTGVFTGNNASNNATFGFETNVSIVAPASTTSPNTATGNGGNTAGENFNNQGATVVQP